MTPTPSLQYQLDECEEFLQECQIALRYWQKQRVLSADEAVAHTQIAARAQELEAERKRLQAAIDAETAQFWQARAALRFPDDSAYLVGMRNKEEIPVAISTVAHAIEALEKDIEEVTIHDITYDRAALPHLREIRQEALSRATNIVSAEEFALLLTDADQKAAEETEAWLKMREASEPLVILNEAARARAAVFIVTGKKKFTGSTEFARYSDKTRRAAYNTYHQLYREWCNKDTQFVNALYALNDAYATAEGTPHHVE